MGYNYNGWNYGAEHENLSKFVSRYGTARLYGSGETPKDFDPRPRMKPIDDQGPQGSCTSMATTRCVEWRLMQDYGLDLELSRQFTYIMGQRVDGIKGDNGATIAGSIEGTRTYGVCPESYAPYTGKYYTRFARKCFDYGKKHKGVSAGVVKDLDSTVELLGSGYFINFGILWTEPFVNADSTRGVVHDIRGQVYGGHSICCCGYKNFGDLFIFANSHGTRYGDRGFFYVPRAAMNALFRESSTVAIAVSGAEGFQKKQLSPEEYFG